MADRAITALTAATVLNSDDLFVLSQSNQAKSATWQLIISYLTTALDGHGGIQSIAKTGTSGLVDTYTVTLADETEYTFTVTNAKSITSIAKTGTSGLVDTYTITYNNGNTETFTVTNGRGITSIVKTSAVSPSLQDSYRVNYNDDTYYDFTVDNGKSIASIVDYWAVSSSNSTAPSTWYTTLQTMTPTNKYLWHYQTITFNDASTLDTYKAVVGVYGDTGQAWYVYIKYASAQPTQDSDMGDIPDKWIGIYSGTEDDPTDLHYTDYEWYQYKGAKGDTGDAAVITSQEVTYMESSSGTVVPYGSWSTTIPAVTQGNYLWTRTILNFNDGSTVTSYSVARMGVDGTGSVSSVNSQSPDANGNVVVEATDIPTDDNTSVQARITGLDAAVETHDTNFADAYDSTATYSVGDYCVYNNGYYRCTTAVSTPDTFDPAKWEEVSVTEAFNSIDSVEKGLAYIVDGDTCATAVPAGAFAYIKNNTHGLAEGLYRNKTSSSFPTSGGTANGTVFEIVSEGGLNYLKNTITDLANAAGNLTVKYGTFDLKITTQTQVCGWYFDGRDRDIDLGIPNGKTIKAISILLDSNQVGFIGRTLAQGQKLTRMQVFSASSQSDVTWGFSYICWYS